MKPTNLMSAFAFATVTAAGLASLAFAQETTAPATEPPATQTHPAPEAMPGMGHDRGGMMGPMGGPVFDFATLDADKDGSVTKAEMDASRATRTAEIDADADGLLSADELAAMQIKAFTARATAMAANMVTLMDTDKDGKLSAAELASRPGPERMFDKIDANADGAVTQAEVDAAMAGMMDRGGKHGGDHRGGHRGDRDGRGWGFGLFDGAGDGAGDGADDGADGN